MKCVLSMHVQTVHSFFGMDGGGGGGGGLGTRPQVQKSSMWSGESLEMRLIVTTF